MSTRFAALKFVVLTIAASISIGSRCMADRSGAVTQVGSKALALTDEMVSFGPRPAGSAGLAKVREWLAKQAATLGYPLEIDTFTGDTPLGPIEMKNLSYTIRGSSSGRKVLLAAHYDSKRFIGFDFVGANDAASSVALLLSLSPEIAKKRLPYDVHVVFLDGEEALVQWTARDSLYGSRHLVTRLSYKSPIRAAIVVDMIGDRELSLVRDEDVDPRLMKILEQVLAERGWSDLLGRKGEIIEDDHTPLIRAGIPTLHLMDFTYGGPVSPGPYWHTREDTLDKISASSLSAIGEIVLDLLQKL
ncbi:MAG: M28 family peptidase [Pseudomonadota bacterium]